MFARRVAVSATIGMGATRADTTYNGSAVGVFRGGLGVRLSKRVQLEGLLEILQGIGQGDYNAILSSRPRGVPFDLAGGSLGVVIGAGPGSAPSRFQASLGVGSYRVSAEDWPQREGRSTNGLAILSGAGVTPLRWSLGELSLGVRGLILPDVRGEAIWSGALELTFRTR